MGVRFLESYLEKNSRIACFQVNIRRLTHDYRKRTGLAPVIVIDGMSCLRPLYGKLSWLNGGQYKEFHDIVHRFINNFIQLGCKLVLFYDGPVQTIKLPVWKKRRLDSGEQISNLLDMLDGDINHLESTARSSFLPNGLGSIFLYIFSQHEDCQVYQTLKECDEEIASYALKNQCFAILGQDTDYVIYRAAQYYLSIKHLDLDHMTTLCYSGTLLASELDIDPAALPVFASLLGNDIIVYESLRDFHNDLKKRGSSWNIVHLIANYIRAYGFKNLTKISFDVFGCEEQSNLLQESICSYDLSQTKSQNDLNRWEPSFNDRTWSRIVESIKKIFVTSCSTAPLYDIIVRCQHYGSTCLEHYRSNKIISSIGNLLKELRRSMYGILLHEKPHEEGKKEHVVSELIMTGFDSMDNFVEVTPKYLNKVKHPGILTLLQSQDKEIEEIRWNILGEVFECDPVNLRYLPKWMIVPALATRYFKKQFPNIVDWELDALLSTNICSRKYVSQDLAKLPSGPLTYRPVWLFSAVSRTYATVSNLISFIGYPIPKKCTLAFQYADGKLFHEKYRQSCAGAAVNTLCEHQVENLELFNTLKCFVIS